MGSSSVPSPTDPPPSPEESHRIEVLHLYDILDTPAEGEFDDLTALAAHVCETPIALISLVDVDRQWFKAKVGMKVSETPRDQSFCAHALAQPELFIVPDARRDARFANNPLVTGEPGIRFYAGAPLISPKDATLGTLCVIDRVPRTLNSAQEWVMQSLATRVMNRLEQRRLRKDQKLPGVHDMQLHELRALVCSSPYRRALWGRLMSFLAWPILSEDFSYAYLDGDFISGQPYPRDIDLILQPAATYGSGAFVAVKRYIDIGLENVFRMHSIRLNFWIEKAPAHPSDYRAHFPEAPPLKNPYLADPDYDDGTIRIDLRHPEITAQFHDALDPNRI